MATRDMHDNPSERKQHQNNTKCCTFWKITIGCGILCAVIAMLYSYSDFGEIDDSTAKEIDSIEMMFNYFDTDGNGVLSLDEFRNVRLAAPRIQPINNEIEYDSVIDDLDELITIQTFYQPLLINTLRKDKDTLSSSSLDNLKAWIQPAKKYQNFGVSKLKFFLQNDLSNVELAHPYYIVDPQPGNLFGSVTLPSTRYFPPQLSYDGEIMIHRLLTAFHPRPFVHSRFAPQGSVACVRAYNAEFIDIVFRIHAEFQLNEHPLYPFWFTPAQFTGHLIISRDANRILDFHVFVPTSHRLNVDMEWLNGPDSGNMEVDIGFVPQMELRATRDSVPSIQNGNDQREKYINAEKTSSLQNIVWDKEVTFEKAASALEVKMYPFKEVQYHNWTSVWAEAERQQKPVHSIILWGALDDQSC